jgi:uracil-DNA glycosylase
MRNLRKASMTKVDPKIDTSWKDALKEEFEADYFYQLKRFILVEKKKYTIYPPGRLIFNAFNHTPLDQVKVVILGQDPYHGRGQAHGLSFSVPNGIKPPPSLINIFRELHHDLGVSFPRHGNLEKWTGQGVLLLNATLTVRANQAGSHQNRGWEQFTNAVIQKISDQRQGVIFLLWGRYAKEKQSLIDQSKHHILTAAHPSPFSVMSGFFGCRHFSKTNAILTQNGSPPIDWQLA